MNRKPVLLGIGVALLLANACKRGVSEKSEGLIKNVKELPENFCKFAPNLYSGGEPTEAHLKLLQKKGIKCIISVDGAEPKVKSAEKLGMRYIHLPIGYDEVPNEVSASLIKLGSKPISKIYLHCHHGKHRGPAVAAVYAQLIGTASPEEVLDKMQAIGTGEEYQGLWRSVKNIDLAAIKNTKPLPLLSTQSVDDLTASMATIDRLYDNVKHHLNNVDSKLNKHPELLHQSVLLQESLKESYRLDSHEWSENPGYISLFKDSNILAEKLVDEIKLSEISKAQIIFKNLKKSCTSCHQDYRN